MMASAASGSGKGGGSSSSSGSSSDKPVPASPTAEAGGATRPVSDMLAGARAQASELARQGLWQRYTSGQMTVQDFQTLTRMAQERGWKQCPVSKKRVRRLAVLISVTLSVPQRIPRWRVVPIWGR